MRTRADVLTALTYYVPVRDNDTDGQRVLVEHAAPGEIPLGMLTLVGSLVKTAAAHTGCTEDEFIVDLRRMWLVTA